LSLDPLEEGGGEDWHCRKRDFHFSLTILAREGKTLYQTLLWEGKKEEERGGVKNSQKEGSGYILYSSALGRGGARENGINPSYLWGREGEKIYVGKGRLDLRFFHTGHMRWRSFISSL